MGMTLGECVGEYINSRDRRGEISKETRRSFRESLGLLVDCLGESTRLGAVTRRDIDRWMGAMKVAEATKRLRLSTVKGMFRWAVIEGYVKVDPTLGINGPSKPRTVPRGLSEADVELLLSGVTDARERLLLLLMIEEGLRAIEVAQLELGDVDLAGRTMSVKGKGGHGRPLPITDGVASAIEAYLAERGRHSGHLLQSCQRSWAADHDGLSAKYVARIAGLAFKRAGIEESGHALRHTFAHKLIDAGADIRDLQGALGHASIATTQVYMAHAELAKLRQFMVQSEEAGTDDAPTRANALT